MEDLIERQKEIVTKLQKRVIARVDPTPQEVQSLSSAICDLTRLTANDQVA